MKKSTIKELLIVCGIFLVALIVRLIYLSQVRNSPLFDAPIVDALYNDQWARVIASGDWIGKVVFYRAPFYRYFLALIYTVFGFNYYAPRIIQFLIASTSCVLIYYIGRKVFNRTTGVIAGLIAAFYGTFIYFEGELLLDSILVFFNLLLLSILISAQANPKNWKWLGAGLVLGLSAITRPTILLFGSFVVLWLWFIRRKEKRFRHWLISSLCLCAGALVLVLPVAVRNYSVSKDFVAIAANSGINFYIGNNPESNGWTAVAPKMPRTEGSLQCSEVSSYWLRKSVDFIRDTPFSFLALFAKKFFLFWEGTEVSNNQSSYFFGAGYSSLLGVLLWQKFGLSFPFGIIAPLALIGIALLIRQWRKFVLIYAFVFLNMLSVIIFFVCDRYRMPVVSILIIFAAYTIYWWSRQIRAGNFKDLLISGLAFMMILVVVNIDISGVNQATKAENYFNLGLAYTTKKQWQEALAAYEKATEIEPRYADAHNNLGNIYDQQGRYAEAIRQYRLAMSSDPNNVRPYLNLGNIYYKLEDFERAAKYYEQAIAIDPAYEKAYEYCGLAYAKLGRFEEAETKWAKVLVLNPKNKVAIDGLGWVRTKRTGQ